MPARFALACRPSGSLRRMGSACAVAGSEARELAPDSREKCRGKACRRGKAALAPRLEKRRAPRRRIPLISFLRRGLRNEVPCRDGPCARLFFAILQTFSTSDIQYESDRYVHLHRICRQRRQNPPCTVPLSARDPGAADVKIKILYCGVCHSDLHQVRNEWSNTIYPCVPGHEIVGTVEKVGSAVTAFKPGDIVGVGCMVDSCRTCESCREGLEQYCDQASPRPTTVPTSIRAPDFWRLFDPHRRRRALRAAGASQSRSRRRRAAALRRHHDLFAAAPLEGEGRAEGRCRRLGRPRPYGREARPCHGRPCVAFHHVAAAKPTTRASSAPMRWWFRKIRSHGRARRELRFHSRYGGGQRTTSTPISACSSATARWCRSARRKSRCRSPYSA